MTWAWLAWLPDGLQTALGIADKVQAAVEQRKAAKASAQADAENAKADAEAGRDRN